MKKVFALLLMFSLMITSAALAEDGYDWHRYEYGFEVMIPSDWEQCEVGGESAELGVLDCFASADRKLVIEIARMKLHTQTTLQELLPVYVKAYPDAELKMINGIECITFIIDWFDFTCFCVLDEANPGLNIFIFSGIEDDTDMAAVETIVGSVRSVKY